MRLRSQIFPLKVLMKKTQVFLLKDLRCSSHFKFEIKIPNFPTERFEVKIVHFTTEGFEIFMPLFSTEGFEMFIPNFPS